MFASAFITVYNGVYRRYFPIRSVIIYIYIYIEITISLPRAIIRDYALTLACTRELPKSEGVSSDDDLRRERRVKKRTEGERANRAPRRNGDGLTGVCDSGRRRSRTPGWAHGYISPLLPPTALRSLRPRERCVCVCVSARETQHPRHRTRRRLVHLLRLISARDNARPTQKPV